MPEIKVDVEVWCAGCGRGICQHAEGTNKGIQVEPCPHCLDETREEEYKKGFDDGRDEAENE